MRLVQLASLAALIPCAVHAQINPDSGENITVTATRTPIAVEKLAAGVTIIDRRTIEERGYISLADALSAVPGLRVVQAGGPGSQTSVFIRGTNSNHVLVLRDGVPISDPADPGGAYNFGVDTLADIERIEIVRGPASSLYGSGAIGGVINLITRHGTGAPHGHLMLAAGAPRAGLVAADVAGALGIWDYAANVQGLSERGFDQTPQRETPVYTGEADGDRSKLAQAELGVTPWRDTRLSLSLRARDAKYGYDEIGGGTVYDSGNATGYDASLFGRIGIASKLLGGAWATKFDVSGLQDDRRYTIGLRADDPNQAQQDDRYHSRRLDLSWNNSVVLPDSAFLQASTLTFGTEHQADRAVAKNNDFGYASDIGLVHAHADADAGYAGLQTTALTRLALNAQLREDATTIAGDAFTWRIGGVVALPEMASHLKFAYGTSFRAPALNDRYGRDDYGGGFGYIGNPNLRPERGQSFEAGIQTDIPVSPATASISAEYFHNRIRDLIALEPVAGGTIYSPVNISQAQSEGVETSLTLQAAHWLQADLTYTYTDARNLATRTQLLRRPYNQASANLRITPWPGVIVAPELLYTGAFQDYPTSDAGLAGYAPALSPSGLLFNINVTWRATPWLEVFAWGKNLGASHFEPVAGYQTPGPSVLAGTRVAF